MQNLGLAFDLLEERLEIPQLLDASDVSNGLVDERSVMTYLSMINRAFQKPKSGAAATVAVSSPEGTPVSQVCAVMRMHLGTKRCRRRILLLLRS